MEQAPQARQKSCHLLTCQEDEKVPFCTHLFRSISIYVSYDLCRIESLQETDSQRKGLAAATATASIAAIVAEEKNQDDPKTTVVSAVI